MLAIPHCMGELPWVHFKIMMKIIPCGTFPYTNYLKISVVVKYLVCDWLRATNPSGNNLGKLLLSNRRSHDKVTDGYVHTMTHSVSFSVTFLGYFVSQKRVDCRFSSSFIQNMVTPSNGQIFLVTGPLCGKFTGHRSPVNSPHKYGWPKWTKSAKGSTYEKFHVRKHTRIKSFVYKTIRVSKVSCIKWYAYQKLRERFHTCMFKDQSKLPIPYMYVFIRVTFNTRCFYYV